ncbi:hypothetical protein [Achromobacter anxifer]|uniref:hypothetical protein n=1 Tax=Achromobacter anxifer TaxID=1287737 RepID=UPI0015907587|nr:hypothetical protein [Achromobacter anxifer]
MLNSSMRSARVHPATSDARRGHSASQERPRWRAGPIALALGVTLGALAGTASAQQNDVYPPPPLFSGQSHRELTAAGAVPQAPASTPTAAAPRGALDPAIQAMVEGKAPQDAAQLTLKGSPGREEVPWLLRGENRPWTLMFTPSNPLGTLYLSPPSAREAKLMLPGMAADAANRARFTVNKYITDSIGISAQARARQLETLNRWIENSNQQAARAKDDDWEKYQFSVESRREIEAYREKVVGQAAPDLSLMQREIQRAVEELSPLLEVMPNYELQMAWYNVLVQLKEGFSLYQAQVQRADQTLLATIDAYLDANPYAARPAGPVPQQGGEGIHSAPAAKSNLSAPTLTPSLAESARDAVREPAPAPDAPAAREQPQSIIPGLSVFGLMVLVGLFVIFKIRRRARRSGGKGAAPTPTA